MQQTITTARLELSPLVMDDYGFIIDLVNTAGWLRFIGNRDVKNEIAAKLYIKNILENPNARYWVMHLKETLIPIGVVTLIKRDYLPAHDIGFALLPQYEKKGYALEATQKVLNRVLNNKTYTGILAILVQENQASIQLLERLGFHFDKEITVNEETLLLYALQQKQAFID